MIRSKSNMRFQILANFILILFTIFVITPFILLIMSSFTEESTLIRKGKKLLLFFQAIVQEITDRQS